MVTPILKLVHNYHHVAECDNYLPFAWLEIYVVLRGGVDVTRSRGCWSLRRNERNAFYQLVEDKPVNACIADVTHVTMLARTAAMFS